MSDKNSPVAIAAAAAPLRATASHYPEPFASRMAGREKRPLGTVFGLSNFGVNLTRLAPGAVSALRHAHSQQDEFIYILAGQPLVVTDAGETSLSPGMCAGFKGYRQRASPRQPHGRGGRIPRSRRPERGRQRLLSCRRYPSRPRQRWTVAICSQGRHSVLMPESRWVPALGLGFLLGRPGRPADPPQWPKMGRQGV